MKNEIVDTISGNRAMRTDCRKIRGEFYKVGDVTKKDSGDCYKINGRYYKGHTGYIVYDHRLNQYVVKKMNVIVEKGVIGLDENEEPIFGSFSLDMENPEPPLLKWKGGQYNVLSTEILTKSFRFQEDMRTGIFVDRKSIDAIHFIQPAIVSQDMKRNLPYDSTGRLGRVQDQYEKMYKPELSEAVKKYDYAIGDLSFGVEFETTRGIIPQRIADPLGLMALRDGSIQGLEYVTIPLQGAKGMQALLDSLKQLRRRTTYDDTCALHFHIGNIPRTEEFFLAFTRMMFLIQDEMFGLFPIYKKENYGVKRKSYTKPYEYGDTVYHFDKIITPEKVTSNFRHLYSFLSMGQDYAEVGRKLENVAYHPSDPHGTSKWNIKSRYYWVNMIPLLFGNKQTVEFRLHTPTYDSYKVMNYLVLCAAIVNYTIKNTTSILENPGAYANIRLDHIISRMFHNKTGGGLLVDSLINYINRRRNYWFNRIKQGDIKGDEKKIHFDRYFSWEGKMKDRYPKPYGSGIVEALQELVNEDHELDIGRPHRFAPNPGRPIQVRRRPRHLDEMIEEQEAIERRRQIVQDAALEAIRRQPQVDVVFNDPEEL